MQERYRDRIYYGISKFYFRRNIRSQGNLLFVSTSSEVFWSIRKPHKRDLESL